MSNESVLGLFADLELFKGKIKSLNLEASDCAALSRGVSELKQNIDDIVFKREQELLDGGAEQELFCLRNGADNQVEATRLYCTKEAAAVDLSKEADYRGIPEFTVEGFGDDVPGLGLPSLSVDDILTGDTL